MAIYCEDHPEHIIVRGWGIVVAAVILGSVSTVVVGTRLWLRVFKQKNVDASDWFMLAGLVCAASSGRVNMITDQNRDSHLHIWWNCVMQKRSPDLTITYAI